MSSLKIQKRHWSHRFERQASARACLTGYPFSTFAGEEFQRAGSRADACTRGALLLLVADQYHDRIVQGESTFGPFCSVKFHLEARGLTVRLIC